MLALFNDMTDAQVELVSALATRGTEVKHGVA